jgi:hypothetical protein
LPTIFIRRLSARRPDGSLEERAFDRRLLEEEIEAATDSDYTSARLAVVIFFLISLLLSLAIGIQQVSRTAETSTATEAGQAGEATRPLIGSPTDSPPPPAANVPRTLRTTNIYVGPSEDHVVMGLLPSGSQLEIVGRDATGEWLAVALAPGSTLYGWIAANAAMGLPPLETLNTVPMTAEPSNRRR